MPLPRRHLFKGLLARATLPVVGDAKPVKAAARRRSLQARPGLELRLDRPEGPVAGTMKIEATGSPGQWREQAVAVNGASGVRDLFMVFRGKGDGSLVDLDYWRFNP